MTSQNKKITELTEALSVDDDDLLVVVVDVAGTPITKKIKRSSLVANIQPALKQIIATGQIAGQLNLTGLLWATNKAVIAQIKVQVSAGSTSDFDIAIYEKDTYLTVDRIYHSEGYNSVYGVNNLIGSLIYIDSDSSNELHFYITDNDGTGAPEFDIEIRGWGLN